MTNVRIQSPAWTQDLCLVWACEMVTYFWAWPLGILARLMRVTLAQGPCQSSLHCFDSSRCPRRVWLLGAGGGGGGGQKLTKNINFSRCLVPSNTFKKEQLWWILGAAVPSWGALVGNILGHFQTRTGQNGRKVSFGCLLTLRGAVSAPKLATESEALVITIDVDCGPNGPHGRARAPTGFSLPAPEKAIFSWPLGGGCHPDVLLRGRRSTTGAQLGVPGGGTVERAATDLTLDEAQVLRQGNRLQPHQPGRCGQR